MKRSSALALFSLAIALYCLLPFLWFVLTSFKTPAELAAIPPKLVPSLHWGFYHSALVDHGLPRYVGNSLIVAGAATLHQHYRRVHGRLRHQPFSTGMDEILPAGAAGDLDVSADRHCRSGLEHS